MPWGPWERGRPARKRAKGPQPFYRAPPDAEDPSPSSRRPIRRLGMHSKGAVSNLYSNSVA